MSPVESPAADDGTAALFGPGGHDMAERYSDEVRGKARDLWLQGKTDEEIAAALGITRPDTIRDWRRKEDWTGMRRVIERGVSLRFDAERNVATADAKSREIRMVDAMEPQ